MRNGILRKVSITIVVKVITFIIVNNAFSIFQVEIENKFNIYIKSDIIHAILSSVSWKLKSL